MVTSPEKLSLVLHDWCYLNSHKDKLYKFCQTMLKGLDGLRQEFHGTRKVVGGGEKSQGIHPTKIKIPASKQKAHDEPADMQPHKKQCRR